MSFDTREGLYSIPVRIGKQNALHISIFSYVISFLSLIYAGILVKMTMPYYVGIILIAVIFFLQQKVARNNDTEPAIKSLFRYNMFISPILFLGAILDVYVV